MPVPERLRPFFRDSTLRVVDTAGDRLRIRKPLFFRSAVTAQVIDNGRSVVTAAVVGENSIQKWRCTCSTDLRSGDLCRHIAKLVTHMAPEGELLTEAFATSIWRAVALAQFQAAAPEPEAGDDARDKLLRGMVATPQEIELEKRGATTHRGAFEASRWFLWSRERFASDPRADRAKLTAIHAAFTLSPEGNASEPSTVAEVNLSDAAVEAIAETGGAAFLRASGFDVRECSLRPSLRIALTAARELRFEPVLIDEQGLVHARSAVRRFGRWFFADGVFATASNNDALFIEDAGPSQGSLFAPRTSSGIPVDRETVIAEEHVLPFLQKHHEALALMRDDLVPDHIRNARPVRFGDDVVFEFVEADGAFFRIRISFRVEGTLLPLSAVAQARRAGMVALSHGRLWIDVSDRQFAWCDSVRVDATGCVLVTRLEYFRIRGSLRAHAVYAGPPELESAFGEFDAIAAAGDAPAPNELGMDLYGYQQTGYRWLWNLQQHDFGALLCDDMGLGKTHQAMALVRALTLRGTRGLPYLVVCPTSLVDHWRDKLQQFAPSLRVATIRAGGRDLQPERYDVIVTSYGILRADLERFRKVRFDVLFADEVQAIKNRDTATHKALLAVERRTAVGLTGTPIENHTGELAALLDFIVPGYLPSVAEDDPAMLRRLSRPFVLRRTKAQVLTQLPPKIVDKRYCELLPEQREIYRRVLDSRGRALRQQLHSGAPVSFIHVFAALNYLKQVCNHPRTAAGEFRADVPSGKWEAFIEILEESLSSGLKVVVFSQYLPMLRLIEQHLDRSGIGWASIKGETRDRGSEVVRFREDAGCRVFTASLRAAGLGIDLTPASVVIHYDRWWNQAREDQATDRVHRLGQNNGVQVIKLITRGTLEERIDRLIERKAALAADVITEDDPALVKQFAREELEELLAD